MCFKKMELIYNLLLTISLKMDVMPLIIFRKERNENFFNMHKHNDLYLMY